MRNSLGRGISRSVVGLRGAIDQEEADLAARTWRGGARTAYLARALKDCAVVCCYTEVEWRRVGELIGRADLDQKKKPDPVDGLVALTAVEIDASIVATSDQDDIQAYLDQIHVGQYSWWPALGRRLVKSCHSWSK
jgi:hypothetical protein